MSLSLHDRSFDLVLLSNWEDQIIYDPLPDHDSQPIQQREILTTPVNQALESGAWTQSIIWDPKTPFRDFTQIEFNKEEDIVSEDQFAGEFTNLVAYVVKQMLFLFRCQTKEENKTGNWTTA